MTRPDYEVQNNLTVAFTLITPRNEAARRALQEIAAEDALWWHGSLAVEPRYLVPILAHLAEAGFTLVES